MEQLRVALAWIVRYHFWLLCGLVALVGIGAWYLGTGDLSARYEENKKKIEGSFSQLQQKANRAFHPNEVVNERQQQEIEKLIRETTAIWQQLYDRQRQEVLKWPSQLSAAFRRMIEAKQFGDEVDLRQREHYTDYIRGRFEDLPKIIDANELDESQAGGGFRGGGRGGRGGGFEGGELMGRGRARFGQEGEELEVDYTVYWANEDQQRIKEELTWDETISHWRIWVTQENLWVYETLLRAIAATNESKGTDRHSNAAVTSLFAMQVGKEAAKTSRSKGRIKRLQGASSLGEFGEMGMGMDGGGELESRGAEAMPGELGMGPGMGEFEDFGGRGEMGGTAGLSPAQEKALLLSGRYVDDQGQPITVAPGDEPLAPTEFGKELKRLPVRLDLEMDVRYLTRLITELANADLQIKVTEVRVDPLETGGAGGFAEGGRGGGGRSGGEFGRGGGFGGGYGTEEILTFERKPYMKPVIIQGVVLIFNEPNPEVLSGEGGEESTDFAAL